MQHTHYRRSNRRPLALVAGTATLIITLGLMGTSATAQPDPWPVNLVTPGLGEPPDNTVDGYLAVTVDTFGSFGAFSPLLWPDNFNPSPDPVEGELDLEAPTFMSTMMIFTGTGGCGPGGQKGVLTEHSGIIDFVAGCEGGTTLNTTIISSQTCGPQPGAGDPPPECQETSSAFQVTGSGVDLRFDVTQRVDAVADGPNGEKASELSQTYEIFNEGPAVTFRLVHHVDEDMPWGGGVEFYLDDLVGVDFAAFGYPVAVAQDRDLITAAMILRTRENMMLNPNTVEFNYYSAKNGVVPPGNPDFPCPDDPFGPLCGTCCEIWDNAGVPNAWRNYVPERGYNIPAISPLGTDGDSLYGLQVEVSLGPGETYELTWVTTYGFRPPPEGCVPPSLDIETTRFDSDTETCEMIWRFTNDNAEETAKFSVFYLDVETGNKGQSDTVMTAPPGWTVTCDQFVAVGHNLYQFTKDDPLPENGLAPGQSVTGTFKVSPRRGADWVNSTTGIEVPRFSVVIHPAQGDGSFCNNLPAAEDCDTVTFGPGLIGIGPADCDTDLCLPAANCVGTPGDCDPKLIPVALGDWGGRNEIACFLAAPAMSTWAKMVLGILLVGGGTLLVLRSRRPVTA